jgi:DNA-binding Lrp family transcriptional regulator
MAFEAMDRTDIALSMLLLNNSRLSYRELAEKLDLSVNAVHKRIQALKDAGIIRRFTAKVSLFALNAVTIMVFGVSDDKLLSDVHKRLGKHGSIYWVAKAGANYLYVGAYLRSISELESLVGYVRKEAKMPNPMVGIVSVAPAGLMRAVSSNALYPLDLQIVRALHADSRKALTDVAEELRVSAKTVRRRLLRMVDKGLIELSMEWYPDASNDIMTVFHVHLKPTAAKDAVAGIFKKYSPNVLFYWSFSNLSNELFTVVWTNTMKELREIQDRFAAEEAFESIVPNILYVGYIFDTWRDEAARAQSNKH